MGQFLRGARDGLLLIAAIVALVWLIYTPWLPSKPAKPAKPEPRGSVEVLAVTESGTTVYRADGPRCIVPVVWVESKDGHVSIR